MELLTGYLAQFASACENVADGNPVTVEIRGISFWVPDKSYIKNLIEKHHSGWFSTEGTPWEDSGMSGMIDIRYDDYGSTEELFTVNLERDKITPEAEDALLAENNMYYANDKCK